MRTKLGGLRLPDAGECFLRRTTGHRTQGYPHTPSGERDDDAACYSPAGKPGKSTLENYHNDNAMKTAPTTNVIVIE